MSSARLCFIGIFLTTALFNNCVLTITNWKKFENRQLSPTFHSTFHPSFLPNNRDCVCIPLARCPPLYNLLSSHPVHPLTIDFLKNQTCGFHGPEPYVCCFDSNNPTAPTPPNVPHPRVERCMVSPDSDDDTSTSNEVETTSETSGFYPRFRPFHGAPHGPPHGPPYGSPQGHPYGHYPGGFPSYDGFHYPHKFDPSDDFNGPPDSSTPTPSSLPSRIASVTEANSDEEKIIMPRNLLLPDDTCGLALDQRIVGGRDVRLGTYSWMARIGYTRPRSSEYLYRCGGTLINPRYVITAAHCTNNLPGGLKLATVRLGELDERTDPDCDDGECADAPQDFTPILVIVHRNYDTPKYKNDISLLKLDRAATITSYVSPICVPFNLMKSTNYTGVQATAAGWGVVNIAVRTSSPTLQHVQLRISDNDVCKTIYSTKFQLDVGVEQMCTTGLNGQDACEGDSGGPLMKMELYEGVPRYFLLGVVSFGPTQCGTSGLPSVYTRISHYTDWILKHIDKEN